MSLSAWPKGEENRNKGDGGRRWGNERWGEKGLRERERERGRERDRDEDRDRE